MAAQSGAAAALSDWLLALIMVAPLNAPRPALFLEDDAAYTEQRHAVKEKNHVTEFFL
jgi:hypothetical protein